LEIIRQTTPRTAGTFESRALFLAFGLQGYHPLFIHHHGSGLRCVPFCLEAFALLSLLSPLAQYITRFTHLGALARQCLIIYFFRRFLDGLGKFSLKQ
jgi:hypothetical protein